MHNSRRIAIGGLISALCLTLMLLTGLVPFGTFALPAFAGILIVVMEIEYNFKMALLTYVAVSALAVFITPDREAALAFIAFLGYYPIIKPYIEMKFKRLGFIIKFALFNTAVLSTFAVLFYVFRLKDIVDSMGDFSLYSAVIMLLLANVTFFVYDMSIRSLVLFYCRRFKK